MRSTSAQILLRTINIWPNDLLVRPHFISIKLIDNGKSSHGKDAHISDKSFAIKMCWEALLEYVLVTCLYVSCFFTFQVFIANQATCMKVHPQQIKKIVRLAADNQNKASEFLNLLNVLVKVEGLDLTIKRNQALVMKYIMQNFKKAAYVLDQQRESR